ncbi:AAA family ATPase [uncultured Xanthomonas sp.]|uniref:ATP-dependent nuclease n=1 Tax=uncultured Xanthomonas sp. TaxID=152831 RepID=UPI0025D03096|nr:AAA family ATPase [uncultured Xanthomonas sp.]
MRVADLSIHNFRGVRQGYLRFNKHVVLVGSNNTGKTTVIEALTLLLGRDRLIRDLTEHDFFGSDPLPDDRIKLIATITGFEGDDPNQHSEWFRDGRAVPKWLDDTTGKVHPLPTESATRLCCQIGVQAYFDRLSLTVEVVRYFHDHDGALDPFDEDSPVAVPSRLIQQFGFFLVRASRTWDRVLSWGSELFRRTIHAAAAQPAGAILAQRDQLRLPDAAIEDDEQIAPLINSVNDEVARCIAGSPKLKLRVTSTDSRSVLDAVAPHYATTNGPSVPAARQGNGLISLQGLFLLLELGRLRAKGGEGFTMALEEPELHLPPATQQQIVLRVQALSSQTFVTTHSPTIAAMADPTSVLLLRNTDGILTAKPFLEKNLDGQAANWQRKFYQHNRTEVINALMHSFVLVPEGRSDHLLLQTLLKPLMLRQGWAGEHAHSFGLEVGLVPTEDAKVVETWIDLQRVHPRVCCLVDGDAEGLRYTAELTKAGVPPGSIIRWPEGQMLEDLLAWIFSADPTAIAVVAREVPALRDAGMPEVVAYAKTKKCDLVLYETLAEAIVDNEACRSRASELFEGMAMACSDTGSAHFAQSKSGWVFQA